MNPTIEPGPPGHCRLVDVLTQHMRLVAPPDRVATMAKVFGDMGAWPTRDRLENVLEASGLRTSDRERDALAAADAIMRWARGERRRVSVEELASRWRLCLGSLPREVVEIALLDPAGLLLPDGVIRLQEGSQDRVVIDPRRMMQLALHHDAAALVLVHNHPSGSVRPTQRDIDATRRVVLAGTTLDVSVADHLIVSSQETFSFRREELL